MEYIEDRLLDVNDSKYKQAHYNMIKGLEFNEQIFNWYLLTRKGEDSNIYRLIQEGKQLKKCYRDIVKNIKKHGNKNMSHEDLVEIQLSKKFNQRVLLPMVKQKAKELRINIYK